MDLNRLKLFFALLLLPGYSIAQVVVETTNLRLVDKKLEISYDILKSKKTQRFDVWVEISNSKGEPVNAQTFNGEVGKNQKGGKGKIITWDYNADGLVLNEAVNVDLKANVSIVEGSVRPGNALLKSLVFPGWGLSTVDKGKPYWLMGVAAYGSLAGSFMLQASSSKNYDKYKETSDGDLANSYYTKSKSQQSNAQLFRYTVIGVWLVSGAWTIIKANSINNSLTAQRKQQNLQFYSQYDPVTKTTGFKLRYNF